MRKRNGRQLTAWVMALLIGVSVMSPMNVAWAEKPTTLDADVTVTGIEDGVFDGSTSVGIKVDFPVPVIGDGVDDYFEHGDEVTLLLSESFMFDPLPAGPIPLEFNGKQLGIATLSNNSEGQAIATITFNGDKGIFDPNELPEGEPPYADVSGMFTANLKYNGKPEIDDEGNKVVRILEKTYKLQLPEETIRYDMEKTVKEGAIDMVNGTIEWTVTITATTSGTATPIDLAGYVFEDDLHNVGKYVPGSFSPTDGSLTIPSEDNTKLAYIFPENSASPQEIKFKTLIPNNVMTAGGTITNDASLYLGDDVVCFDDFPVTITKPTATKTGETNDIKTGETYNPTDRTITWYIKVDNDGRVLKDLIITDELQSGLTLDNAQWQKLAADGETWEDVTGAIWNGPTAPTGNQYKIGDIVGDVNYVGRLKIVSKVPDGTDGSFTATTYNNKAYVSWTGAGDTSGSAETGNPGVGIGYNALTKTGTQTADDVTKHQITWTINTDMKGQSATDFKIYDLFVHDATTTDLALTQAAGWPAGVSIGSSHITRNNGQKFVEVVSMAAGVGVTVTDLKNSAGDIIATLVTITNLNSSTSNEVKLKSQVVDPAILAGNDPAQTVNNTVSLYKDTTYRGKVTASVSYNNKILAKELLNRDEVGNDHTTDGVINANNRTTDVANGFHYGYKEVIFRLNVNAAGLDFANVATNKAEGFGDVIITDTLPEGWEFTQFSGGQDYLIYNTTGTLSTGGGYPDTGSLTTTGNPLDPATILGLTADFAATGDPRTATFTFTDLDQPYVILVKARPTGDTFDEYLTGDNTRNETNTLTLKSTNWTPGKTVTQNVKIDSTILDKSNSSLDLSQLSKGILIWNVKYTTFEKEIGTGLEDTLPQGIDLRTDSSGQLIWEQDGIRNINVHVLNLNPDGSGNYELGSELTLDVLKAHISYSGRTLSFAFPDKTKSYLLSYVTDITGMPGIVYNSVKLVDAEGAGTSTDKSFTITEQQGAATMGRSGFLVVKKTDKDLNPLMNAEFTLYNTNEDGSKGTARAVRITATDGTVKFYGLPTGNYILVETKAPGDEYEKPVLEYNVVVDSALKTTVNGSDIITLSAPFGVVNYKTEDHVGSLTISKIVAGVDADTTKIFEFTLTLSDAPGTYTYVGQGVPGGTIKSGDTVSLAHGQSITIVGLPDGATYTVTEKDYADVGYTVTSTGETGEIVSSTTKTAAFTNTRTIGSLVIAKTVAGNAGDRAKNFEFTINFSGAPGTYTYVGNGVPDGTIRSGDTVSLAHGQSITILNLPKGATYTVTEADYSDDGYTTVSANPTGEIVADTTKTAAFTNTRTVGSLAIAKTVVGNAGDRTKSFDFTVNFSGAADIPYAYVGNGVPDGTIRSGDTVSLAHGQSITILNLPEGTTYTVIEADYSDDGYTTVSKDPTGEIVTDTTKTAAFTNTKQVNSPDGQIKTGDNNVAALAKYGLIFFSAALLALFIADFDLRKKHSKKRDRK